MPTQRRPLRQRLRALLPRREQIEGNRYLRWLAPWLTHPALWRWSRRGVALGVALGVFFGLLIPLAQIPVTAVAAIALRANLPAAAASTFVTNPVTFGPVYYAAWRLGNWLTGTPEAANAPEAYAPPDALAAEDDEPPDDPLWRRIVRQSKPLFVGLSFLALAAGLTAYLIIDLLWRWHISRKWRRRRKLRRRRSIAAIERAD